MIDPTTILQDLSGRYAQLYASAIADLFAATVDNNRTAAADARARLGEHMVATAGAAEVLGASLMLRAAARELAPTRSAFGRERRELLVFADQQTVIPRVTLDDALQDLVDRTPVTIRRAAERTAARIAEIYSTRHAMAFVRSAEASVTRAAQDFIARAFREGLDEGEAGRRLAMSVNEVRKRSAEWTDGYARMVLRTNVNTGVTAGRFRQAQDPDIKLAIPAFRFDAIGDGDTRDNHAAADGIILAVDNVAWNKIAPPLGYNCRCQVSHVSRVELEMAGRIDRHGNVVESRVPPDAFPDDGFRHGGRPDLFGVAR